MASHNRLFIVKCLTALYRHYSGFGHELAMGDGGMGEKRALQCASVQGMRCMCMCVLLCATTPHHGEERSIWV